MKEPNANPAAVAASGLTPGVLLKAARQEQGLSVVDVAARLCLNVQYIEDIERNDFSHMRARVYARGHVISYAHLLGVPEAQVLSALNNVKMEFITEKNTMLNDNMEHHSIPIYQSSESSQQRPSLMLWGSVLILIIVVGLVMMWWKGPSATSAKTVNPAVDPTSVNLQPQAPAPAKPAVVPAAPLPPPPSPTSVSSSPQSSVSNPPPQAQDQQNQNQNPQNPDQQAQNQNSQNSQNSQNPQDQSTLQPSEFNDSSRAQSSPATPVVALPPPRASNNNVGE